MKLLGFENTNRVGAMHSNFKQLHSFGAEVSSKEMQQVPRIVRTNTAK